jgi:hypothetical protein
MNSYHSSNLMHFAGVNNGYLTRIFSAVLGQKCACCPASIATLATGMVCHLFLLA